MTKESLFVAFVCLWLAWIALTGSLDFQELGVGAIVAAFVAVVSYELLFRGGMREKFEPKRWVKHKIKICYKNEYARIYENN